MIISYFNLLRLALLGLIALLIYPFARRQAVYFFLRFAGPTFIKLGQALAARPDIISVETAKILAKFQDNLAPFSRKKVEKILQKEFGKNFSDQFIEFDFEAKASASIAQVHKARIAKGDEVAVKILRPNIHHIFKRDVKTIALIAKISKLFSPFLYKTLSNITELLKETQKSELNLLHEAKNAIRLKEELEGLEGFYVPSVFLSYSSKNILTTSWVHGIPFTNKEAIANIEFDKKEIAKNLVHSYFTQVYENGFFHADMHQGNLLLMPDGTIAAVDFGIMAEIDKKTRLAIAEILIGFLKKDYEKVAALHIKAGLVPQNTDVKQLAISCKKIGDNIVGNSVKDIQLSNLLGNLITLSKDYQLNTKKELLLLQKTALLVEGVGIMLDPNLNMWVLAEPWMKEWAKKNIGFDAKIRDAIVDFIAAIKSFVKQIKK